MPMTWQAVATFLACARIGAVHSAVFAGFSAESLRDRVNDCECRVLITTEYVVQIVIFGSALTTLGLQ
jgi:acetyl-CoA synthetase